jgi:hypothetical protein
MKYDANKRNTEQPHPAYHIDTPSSSHHIPPIEPSKYIKMNGDRRHVPITPYSGFVGTNSPTASSSVSPMGSANRHQSGRDQRHDTDVANAAHSATMDDIRNRQNYGNGVPVSNYFGAEFVRNPDGKLHLSFTPSIIGFSLKYIMCLTYILYDYVYFICIFETAT